MFSGNKKYNFFFSQLAKFEVEDKNGKKIGKPGDALFTKDIIIESLILFGGHLEEKMEDLHLRKNIDPIVPLTVIDSIDEQKGIIRLKVAKDELKTTDNNFKAPEGLIQYIKLKKLPIYEKDNVKIGRVIDILFKAHGGYSFLVGGSELEELLEEVRIIPDKDLIVPSSSVIDISDKIKINENKNELVTTLFQNVKNPYHFLEIKNSEFVTRRPLSAYEVERKEEMVIAYPFLNPKAWDPE